MLWLNLGTGVLHAEDTPVVAFSQVASTRLLRANLDWERLPPSAEAEPPRSRDYTGWLIAGYLTVPVLVLGLPLFVSHQFNDGRLYSPALVAGLIGAELVPGFVHTLNGELSRGARAWGGVAATFLSGLLVGYLVDSAMDEAQDDDDSYDSAMGMLIGAGIGVTGWAIYDVVDSAAPSEDSVESSAAIRFGVAPSPAGVAASVGGRF